MVQKLDIIKWDIIITSNCTENHVGYVIQYVKRPRVIHFSVKVFYERFGFIRENREKQFLHIVHTKRGS